MDQNLMDQKYHQGTFSNVQILIVSGFASSKTYPGRRAQSLRRGGAGIGSVQPASLTVITFLARLTDQAGLGARPRGPPLPDSKKC